MSVSNLPRRHRAVRPSPVFAAVVAVTAVGGVLSWLVQTPASRLGDLGVFLLVLGGWLVSVCLHEFAHAYAAYRAGDRSVLEQGYLTLNPFRYTHPVLSILLPLVALVGGGFALPGGAVSLHPHRFRSRAALSAASAAGPLVNLVLALALLWTASAHGLSFAGGLDLGAVQGGHSRWWTGLAYLGFLEMTAAVLNLLPVPGLDGYGMIEPYLDPQTRQVGNRVKPWGMLGVLLVLFYAVGVRNAFFTVVDTLCRWVGGNDLMIGIGGQFFRFWARYPY